MSEIRPGGPSAEDVGDFSPDMLPEVQQGNTETESVAGRIVERIIGAASVETTPEVVLEKTHEAKDENTVQPSYDTPMQSVGAILHQQVSNPSQTQPQINLEQVDPMQQTHQAPFADTATFTNYKLSMKYGFLAAIVCGAVIAILIW